MGHIELRDGQAVLLEPRQDLLPQVGGDVVHPLVDLQQVDLLVLDDGGQVAAYRVDDQRAEGVLHGLGKARLIAPRDAAHGAY